jgi:uncharacterized protein YbjT (DUF2867 family)
MKKILIAGATGTAGQSLVTNFKNDGYIVYGLSHSRENKEKLQALDCIPLFANLLNPDETSKLLEQIKPDMVLSSVMGRGDDAKQQEWEMGVNLIRSSQKTQVSKYIYVSVYRSDQHTGIPHFDIKAEIEKELKHSGMDYLIIRPATFMDGLLSPWFLQSVKEKNTIVSPMDKDINISYIHTNDIARTILFALRNNFKNETYTIGGKSLSITEIQKILTQKKKQPVSYQKMPIEQVRQYVGEDIATMVAYFNQNSFEVNKNILPKGYEPEFIQFEQIIKSYL